MLLLADPTEIIEKCEERGPWLDANLKTASCYSRRQWRKRQLVVVTPANATMDRKRLGRRRLLERKYGRRLTMQIQKYCK